MRKRVAEDGDVTFDRDGNKINDLRPAEIIAEKAGVSFATLCTWLERPDRAPYMFFFVADRLICAAGNGVVWWREEMPDHYNRVNLNYVECACPGCTVVIHHDPLSKGPKPKWCSASCASAGQRIARGETQARHKRYFSTERCRNGHTRTPENQNVEPSGRIRCADCQKDANARAYAKRKASAPEALLVAA